MKRIGIISDTHGFMDERIAHHLNSCDEIWHAGDIGSLDVTDQLAKLTTLRGVYGNIDDHIIRKEFPLDNVFTIEGFKVYITHIAGRPGRYSARVKEVVKSENPNILVCGHSHICLVSKQPPSTILHINPGAAGIHGFHQVRTLVRLSLDQKSISDIEVIELGKR